MGWTPSFVHCGPATRFSEVSGTTHRVYGVLESKQTACISKHFDVKTTQPQVEISNYSPRAASYYPLCSSSYFSREQPLQGQTCKMDQDPRFLSVLACAVLSGCFFFALVANPHYWNYRIGRCRTVDKDWLFGSG